jgi:hypothetical protein
VSCPILRPYFETRIGTRQYAKGDSAKSILLSYVCEGAELALCPGDDRSSEFSSHRFTAPASIIAIRIAVRG